MRKAFVWATIVSGAIAAYLLYRRGVPLNQIAEDVTSHPIRSMTNELPLPASQPSGA